MALWRGRTSEKSAECQGSSSCFPPHWAVNRPLLHSGIGRATCSHAIKDWFLSNHKSSKLSSFKLLLIWSQHWQQQLIQTLKLTWLGFLLAAIFCLALSLFFFLSHFWSWFCLSFKRSQFSWLVLGCPEVLCLQVSSTELKGWHLTEDAKDCWGLWLQKSSLAPGPQCHFPSLCDSEVGHGDGEQKLASWSK